MRKREDQIDQALWNLLLVSFESQKQLQMNNYCVTRLGFWMMSNLLLFVKARAVIEPKGLLTAQGSMTTNGRLRTAADFLSQIIGGVVHRVGLLAKSLAVSQLTFLNTTDNLLSQ